LTIVGPDGRADLAVPVSTTVSNLLLVVQQHLPAEASPPGGAWVLQRLGEEPLASDATPSSAGLRHGDVLHLRPVDEALPTVDFDDVADGVASAIGARSDRWRPELTRTLLQTLACLVLAGLAASLVGAGPGRLAAIGSGVVAMILGSYCALGPEAGRDRVGMVVAGLGGCAFAAFAGLSVARGPAGVFAPQRMDVLLAAACTAAIASALLASGRLPVAALGTVLVAAGAAAAGAGLATASGWDATRTAAVLAVAMFLIGHTGPRLSLRMARLRVPQLPRTAEELQHDIDPEPEERLTQRVAAADAYLSTLAFSSAAVSMTAFALLVQRPDWIGWVFTTVFSGALLLRARGLTGVWQRIPTAICGTAGVVLVLFSTAMSADGSGRVVVLLVLLAGAVLLLVGARRLPRTRLLPVWGNTADILEICTAMALIPLLLQVLHAYAYLRSLSG
jgi:type VII secretion integral membrane protein EccD